MGKIMEKKNEAITFSDYASYGCPKCGEFNGYTKAMIYCITLFKCKKCGLNYSIIKDGYTRLDYEIIEHPRKNTIY